MKVKTDLVELKSNLTTVKNIAAMVGINGL
jgi:hypothetical protein